jgi:tRNA (cmo5U34)-methyltransferase
MPPEAPPLGFDRANASAYDERFAKLAPFRDALHFIISAVFSHLPADARILCVGAGTGSELLYLAQAFPAWSFTAVEPSAAMLEVCRRKAKEAGIADRCTFHEGYLDSLPSSSGPFHAATSLLVSQFILDAKARANFFRAIAARLLPDGILATADLATDLASSAGQSLLEVWLRLMKTTDLSPEQLEGLRTAYGRDVAVLPPQEVSAIVASGGFEDPVLFLQTGLIHAWYAKRNAGA